MTFQEFQASRIWHDDLGKVKDIDFCEGVSGYTYGGESLYIEKLSEGEYAGQYDLLIERSEYIEPEEGLGKLERILWEWAKGEGYWGMENECGALGGTDEGTE